MHGRVVSPTGEQTALFVFVLAQEPPSLANLEVLRSDIFVANLNFMRCSLPISSLHAGVFLLAIQRFPSIHCRLLRTLLASKSVLLPSARQLNTRSSVAHLFGVDLSMQE